MKTIHRHWIHLNKVLGLNLASRIPFLVFLHLWTQWVSDWFGYGQWEFLSLKSTLAWYKDQTSLWASTYKCGSISNWAPQHTPPHPAWGFINFLHIHSKFAPCPQNLSLFSLYIQKWPGCSFYSLPSLLASLIWSYM